MLAIPRKRVARALIYFLTKEDVEALLHGQDHATWIGLRDRTLQKLAVQTGLRSPIYAASCPAHTTARKCAVQSLKARSRVRPTICGIARTFAAIAAAAETRPSKDARAWRWRWPQGRRTSIR
jgi:hypothetical protein